MSAPIGHVTADVGAPMSAGLPEWYWMSTEWEAGGIWHICVPNIGPLCGRSEDQWVRSRKAQHISDWQMREIWGPLRGTPCEVCVRAAARILRENGRVTK